MTIELLEAIGEFITLQAFSKEPSPGRRVLTAILTILFVVVAVFLFMHWWNEP